MRTFKIALLSLTMILFMSSCIENRMHQPLTEEGTPTNADSVLPAKKSEPYTVEDIQKWNDEAPVLYQR